MGEWDTIVPLVRLATADGNNVREVHEATQQADEADEGRLEPSGRIMVGPVIVNQGKVVRPSQLIRSVGQTLVGVAGAR